MSNSDTTILVVDDDPKIRLLLRRCLESDEYAVAEAANSREIDAILARQKIDLITLDLQLTGENGLDIAKNLRAKSKIPIIMVTGKGDVIDRVLGLEMGADDYIAKPFHVREVLARVHSVLRRTVTEEGKSTTTGQVNGNYNKTSDLAFDGWKLSPARVELTDPDGKACDLTTAEFKLLMVFLDSPNRVLSRDQLMDRITGTDWNPTDRTIDNQVARLRKRIESDPAHPKLIKTVRGIGYIFAGNVETAA